MSTRGRCLSLAVAAALVLGASCKPGREKAGRSGQAGTASPAEIAAVKEAMTRGMQEIAPDSLNPDHIGRQCVVVAQTSDERKHADSAPPPLGMVRRLGPLTAYKGEIADVSPSTLSIRAPYPTSGRYKNIEIARSDVQSIHLAP
jgi:hypothetical protein